MAARRNADDPPDTHVRYSLDALRDNAARNRRSEDWQRPLQPLQPLEPLPPRLQPGHAASASPQDATGPSLRINTNLYTIPSNVEATSHTQNGHNAQAQTTGRPSAVHEDATTPTAGQTHTTRAGRPSGVSFIEPARTSITRSRLGLGLVDNDSLDGTGTVSSGKGTALGPSATTRVSEASDTLAHYRDWLARQRERQRRWTTGPYTRFKHAAAGVYRRAIVEGLLRQRPLPPSADGRHILLDPGRVRTAPLTDERSGKPYVSNFIRSSRYTVWDFLPRQLVFQFMKLANFYFLIISILQMIPGLSTTGTYTTIAPLIFFVALSMFKEGYDDYRRYRLDRVENHSTAWVLDPGHTVAAQALKAGRVLDKMKMKTGTKTKAAEAGAELATLEPRASKGGAEAEAAAEAAAESGRMPWASVTWQELRVGDVVRLRRDDAVPADLVVLSASGPNGVAYIETMALDGETNLKSKQACPLLAAHCGSLAGMAACGAEIVSEDPNLDLYDYEGRVRVGAEAMPLTLHNVVFRGSVVRNTAETVGMVVNTGEECKIRMNAHRSKRAKAPAMQGKVNRIVLFLVVLVVLLSVGLWMGNRLWKPRHAEGAWYLADASLPVSQILFAFIIMFNTLIPLSLYVSLEIIKLGQLYLLADTEMYDADTDTPMVANTTTILEDLGQIGYVFSDKTGTLTENKMRFRKMSVAGTAWLHDMDLARDEAERADRERDRERERAVHLQTKKKGKLQAALGRLSLSGDKRPSLHLEQESHTQLPSPGEPRHSMSASLWRSTARPGRAQGELKTEDLLQYLRLRPHTAFSRKARHLLLCIALCHTCLPETTADGTTEFQAASPDELALVQAARDLGFLMVDRPAQAITLQTSEGRETYAVLDVVEFSSRRKRMSIVVRMPDGRICLLCKGADSVILPRLKLSQMALAKATAVERRASKRKSVEQERAMLRRSLTSLGPGTPRTSMSARHSSQFRPRVSTSKRSTDRRSGAFSGDVDGWLRRREREDLDVVEDRPRPSNVGTVHTLDDDLFAHVDESVALNEGAVFERCFQHIDDFASEGLRTLLYAHRYVSEDEYGRWKAVYGEATTSLVDRQARIEAAADLLECQFDLTGATAIEDKLQAGVPETIDKLRRAHMKIWMLTGDKRETAVNIAHAARICKPFSEVYVLDALVDGDGRGLQERIAATLVDVGRGMTPHAVVVIDGHTLGVVEAEADMRTLFFDLVARVDSVICCRASPAQKATLVKCIRQRVPQSMTLAIGDGANDIAMIQASHVGVGISGREGLQAARIADYAIAQFRFLQRLLLVHGRWNYVRTGKYILGTFWKEIVFYLVQGLYQPYNGYTGTSLYESTSLTVFNTLFTSLPVILLGIFDKDLRADTLLAVPELYAHGQRNRGFSFRSYLGWMIMGVAEAFLIFYIVYAFYARAADTDDTTLYAMGSLAFSACVIFINIRLLVLEMHTQTIISAIGLLLSVGGWFLWGILLSVIFGRTVGPYMIRRTFLDNFGATLAYWTTLGLALAAVVGLELVANVVRRTFWATDLDRMQQMEHDRDVRAVMREHADGDVGGEVDEVDNDGEVDLPTPPSPADLPTPTPRPSNLSLLSPLSPVHATHAHSPRVSFNLARRHSDYLPPTAEDDDPEDAHTRRSPTTSSPDAPQLAEDNAKAG